MTKHGRKKLETVCVCVIRHRHTIGPGLMDGSLLVELLCQVLQPLQTSDLAEDPLLVAFLCSLQIVPRSVDILTANSTNYRFAGLFFSESQN